MELNRYPKRAILATNDFILFNLALWLAMSFRLGELFVPPNWQMFLILSAAPFIGVATFFQMGVYRIVTRFMGRGGALLTAVAVGLSALYWALLVYFSGVYTVPRSVVVLYPLLATALIWLSRQAAGWLLMGAGIELPTHITGRDRSVLIYGAGTTGVQLLEALNAADGYKPVAFVDPEQTLAGQYRRAVSRCIARACHRSHPALRRGGGARWQCPRRGATTGRQRCASSSS